MLINWWMFYSSGYALLTEWTDSYSHLTVHLLSIMGPLPLFHRWWLPLNTSYSILSDTPTTPTISLGLSLNQATMLTMSDRLLFQLLRHDISRCSSSSPVCLHISTTDKFTPWNILMASPWYTPVCLEKLGLCLELPARSGSAACNVPCGCLEF